MRLEFTFSYQAVIIAKAVAFCLFLISNLVWLRSLERRLTALENLESRSCESQSENQPAPDQSQRWQWSE
jgi:hypothetical protein